MRPITFNGYVYGYNSPPNFSDPSGYDPVWCAAEPYETSPGDCYPYSLIEFGGASGENWNVSEKWQINRAAAHIARRLAETYNEYMFSLPPELSGHLGGLMYLFDCGQDNHPLTPPEAFLAYYGQKVLFYKRGVVNNPLAIGFYATTPTGRAGVNVFLYPENKDLYLADPPKYDATKLTYHINWPNVGYQWATHELGHYFEARANDIMGYGHVRNTLGKDSAIPRRGADNNVKSYGFAGTRYGWQQGHVYFLDDGKPDVFTNTGEEFADMFLGWNYNRWEVDPIDDSSLSVLGQARSNFMERHMAPWIALVINRERQNTQ
jgi:hypothetical protein